MLAEQIPCPTQSGCRCLMTSTKEGRALSHQLAIAHRLPVFVPRLQQDREEIIALYGIVAPLLNKARNALTQHRYSSAHTQIARQRPAIRWRQERREVTRNILVANGHSRPKLISLRENIGIKQSLTNNTHSNIGHL